jgi:hypothetical protein
MGIDYTLYLQRQPELETKCKHWHPTGGKNDAQPFGFPKDFRLLTQNAFKDFE